MPIQYQLEVIEPLSADLSRHQLTAGSYTLGRASSCDVVLAVDGLSRQHIRIDVLPDGGAVVNDQGSTNGTRLSGRPITHAAVAGDFVLDLGAAIIRCRALDPALGDLAYQTGHDAGSGEFERAEHEPATAVLTLSRALHQDVWQLAWDNLAPLTLVRNALPAWRQTLRSAAIAFKSRSGEILALDGDAKRELVPVWANDHYALMLAANDANGDQVGDILGTFLDWLPPPAAESQDNNPASTQAAFPGVWPNDEDLQRRLIALSRVAMSSVSILLLGETGTGKDLLANWIHGCSSRSDGPFIAINCAALPQDLLEAELFGIEAGAATGVNARPGVFERADGGTLFLDELGDMPADTQVRLLRVLEDGSFYRIGGNELKKVDIRLVAATNRDLHAAIEQRGFRLDLFHRLAAFETQLPALRNRPDDIASLAIHFFNAALEANGQRSPGITRQALIALQQWHWPGNVRELKQAIDSATALLRPGEALDQAHLPSRLADLTIAPVAADDLSNSDPLTSLADAVAGAERRAIAAAIKASDGAPEVAWKKLRVGKTTFYKKLKEHGLELSAAEDST